MVVIALIVALATEAPAKPVAPAIARPAAVAVMHQDARMVAQPPVTIAIDISAGNEKLWAGSLRVGGMGGGSSFSESKSEFEDPCPGRTEAADRYYSSNNQLSLNINRQMSPEDPDQFWVNVSWGRPVPRCEGNGTNTVGFNRLVTLSPGQTVQLGGETGLLVKLTRQR